MIAILSDIHGNLEALTAVLADIQNYGVSEIYNLGDTLGYGPNPAECLDLAMTMDVVLLGNHDIVTRSLSLRGGAGLFHSRSPGRNGNWRLVDRARNVKDVGRISRVCLVRTKRAC
jgi:predicted phosphodiesterase